jgi:hypothetical protein
VSECAVIVPVLNRPERVIPVMKSLAHSLVKREATIYFVASERDRDELAALYDAKVPHFILPGERRRGDYARKINHAIPLTDEPWLFLGADDLRFGEGWLDVCIAEAMRWRKRVIGTNDLGNREVVARRHSTHTLVARSYIEELGTIDQPGKALHEGYDHQWCDNEFIETAKHRAEFISSGQAVVEHLHPHWGKGPEDSTYSLAVRHGEHDRKLFRQRRRLWRGGSTVGPRRSRR